MLRRLTGRLADERGIALVMALGVLLVLSITLTSLIYYTGTNSRSSARDRAAQQAHALAEAGVNNALAVLSKPGADLEDPNLLPDGTTTPPHVNRYEGGHVEWSGKLVEISATNGGAWRWELSGTGVVANPTGPGAAPVRRTVNANVNLFIPDRDVLSSPVWNWIYSGAIGATCDTVVDQGVTITAPFYVVGNLCMKSTASVERRARPIAVVVEGNVSLEEVKTAIGSNAARIDQVKIGGTCSYQKRTPVPCEPYYNTTTTNVWRHGPYTGDPIRLDQADWGYWYEKASPGPRSPCAESSGTPPQFDVDGLLRERVVPGVFHLTPGTSSYRCKTRRGELSWDHTTRTLTVQGTIFIDGSAKIENGVVNTYNAFSAVYLTGTLLIKNSSMCAWKEGEKVGSACDNVKWNPNDKMLIFAADGRGGQISTPDTSIELVSSEFQGGLYGTWAVKSSTFTSTQGPQVSHDDVQIGQSNEISFPLITQVPTGAPTQPPPPPRLESPDVG